jgi:hypothetical protein
MITNLYFTSLLCKEYLFLSKLVFYVTLNKSPLQFDHIREYRLCFSQ